MKIAIDVSQMCYEGTGVARYVKGLTEALLNLKTDHQFLLYAGTLRRKDFFSGLKNTSPWDKVEWKILPLPPKIASLGLNSLPVPIELLIGKVDLYHSSDWSNPISKCPAVTTVHDLVFAKYPETVDKLILDTQTRRLQNILKYKTHIISDSLSTKNDLMEKYSISSKMIDVIYPGINQNYGHLSNINIDQVKSKYKLPDKFILSVGTQEPRKNLERLSQAAEKLGIPLVLVGRHGWGEKTQTLGFVPDDDLPSLYASASVFAYPSIYEGFGFPLLEAMSCGVPVVTSNISSMPEIVGNAGVLIDPLSVDSIAKGINLSLQERSQYIAAGMAQVKKFTWDNTAKQVMEVYEKITNRN